MRAHHHKARKKSRLPLPCCVASVIFAAIAALLYMDFAEGLSLAKERASRVFVEASTNAVGQIDSLLDSAIVLARAAPSVKGIGDTVTGDGGDNPALSFLTSAVQGTSSIYAAYYGLADGSFLEIIGTHGNPAVIAALSAPTGTALVRRVVVVGGQGHADRTQSWIYLDAGGKAIGRRDETNPAYDPRNTDWYRRILTDGDAKLSVPYRFSSIPVFGMTVARGLPGMHGVFGVDFTLDELSQFVGGIHLSPNGVVYLFDDALRLLAAPPDGRYSVTSDKLFTDMRPLGRPTLQALADLQLTPGRRDVNEVKVNSANYLASIVPWHGAGEITFNIGLAAPLDDFAGDAELTTLLISMGVCAVLAVGAAILGIVSFIVGAREVQHQHAKAT